MDFHGKLVTVRTINQGNPLINVPVTWNCQMSSKSLSHILSSENLPTLPEIAVRVVQIAQQPEPDMRELVATVRTDGAITGRILKFANSALFGARTKTSSIDSAVTMLGVTMIRTLVLGFSLPRQKPGKESLDPWFRHLWLESLIQAAAAEMLAERDSSLDAPTWFLGGLLQDIGRVAMLNVLQDDYVSQVLAPEDYRPQIEREIEAYGFSHVDVSVGLCQKWNLDQQLVGAIARHHQDIARTVPVTSESRTELTAGLIAANTCSEYMEGIVRDLSCAREEVEHQLLTIFGFRPDEVFRLLADLDRRMIDMATGMSIDVGNPPMREEILAKAQASLVDIAMRSQLQLVYGGEKPSLPAASPAPENNTLHTAVEWVDVLTDAFNRKFLLETLPGQLTKYHANAASSGFLIVSVCSKADGPNASIERGELCRVAEAIRMNVRPADVLTRYDVDTFVMQTSGVNLDMLAMMGDRILDWLCLDDDAEVSVRVSGILHLPTGRKPTPARLLTAQLDRLVTELRSATGNHSIPFVLMQGKKSESIPRSGTGQQV